MALKNVIQITTPAEIHDKNFKEDVTLDDALDLTGYGWYGWKIFGISYFILAAQALEMFGFSMLLPASSCDLNLDNSKKGILGATPMMGVVVSAHAWGYLADTRGRRQVLLVSMLGTFLFGTLSSLSPHWIVMAALKFISCIFASATNAVAYPLFGECTPRERRDKMILLITSGLLCSQGYLAAITWPTLQLSFSYSLPLLGIVFRPWRLLAMLFAMPCGIGFLLVFTIKESPKFLLSRGRHEEALDSLRTMFVQNTGRKPEAFPVKSLQRESTKIKFDNETSVLKSIWQQTIPLFKRPLLRHTLTISYIVVVIYMIPPSFVIWLPTITNSFLSAVESGKLSDQSFCEIINMKTHMTDFNSTMLPLPQPCDDTVKSLSILISGCYGIVMSLSNVGLAWVVKAGGKRGVIAVLHGAAGVAGVLVGVVRVPVLSVVLFFLFQITLVCMSLTTAFIVQVYPTYLRGMASCLSMMVGRGSSVIGLNLIAIFMEKHCDVTYYLFGTLILSGAAVATLLPKDDQIIKHEDERS